MSWLQALGGIGQGVSQGIQDWERMDNAKYLKEQREREKAKQKEEDALEAGMAGLDPNDPDYYKKASAIAQQNRRSADAVRYRGLSEAAEDRKRRLSREDIDDRAKRAGEIAKNAAYLHGIGDHAGALRLLQGGYGLFPDNRKVVIDDQAGTWGIANSSGKWEVQPQPIDKETVGRAVDFSMKFANPALWGQFRKDDRDERHLNLEGRKVDIEGRKADTDASYKTGMLGVYKDQNALSEREFDAKNRGGMFTRPAERPQLIGINDDGTSIIGLTSGGPQQYAVPPGYSKLFPKATGERVKPTRYTKKDDGTEIALDANDDVLFNLLPDGRKAPAGVTATTLKQAENEAKKRGVRAMLGTDGNGKPILAYVGKDGTPYDTLEEAAKAKPAKK